MRVRWLPVSLDLMHTSPIIMNAMIGAQAVRGRMGSAARRGMKVSKDQATENRDAILNAAAAQIRARGFNEVSVAEVGRAAGLTHGALYSHFKSKEALQAAATRRAFEQTLSAFEGLDFNEFSRRYLSCEHRDSVAVGCPNAALVSEVWRQPNQTQEAYRDGLLGFLSLVREALGGEGTPSDSDRAIALFATMVGGLALSRAIAKVDESASEDILRAVASQIDTFSRA